MNDKLTYPANKQEPDAPAAGSASDPLRGLKDTIISVGRSRAEYFTYEELDGRTEDELKDMLASLNERPVLIYEDAPFRNPTPPMMMTYAGPRVPNNGMRGFFTQMMNQATQPAQEPQPPQEQPDGQAGFCRTCGSPLGQKTKFCPNCGAALQWE